MLPETVTWRTDALLLLAAPLVGLYLMHGVLGNLGLFGSLSLPRYFISISPMAAVLALLGILAMERRIKRGLVVPLRILVIALPLASVGFLMAIGDLPTAKNLQTQRLDVAAAEVRRLMKPADFDTHVIAGHPYLIYALGMTLDGPGDLRAMTLKNLEDAPAGTVLVIDNYLWNSGDRPPPATLEKWGYRMDEQVARDIDALEPSLGAIRVEAEVSRVRLWIKDR